MKTTMPVASAFSSMDICRFRWAEVRKGSKSDHARLTSLVQANQEWGLDAREGVQKKEQKAWRRWPLMLAETRMKDWNHKEIAIAHSKGGVIVTAHPSDNLIRTGCVPWPPSEIVQNLYQSRHIRAFAGADEQICTSGLGFYCDQQSIHSEDAITWAVFGTAARASQPVLKAWLADLLRLLDLRRAQTDDPEVFLWRHLPHAATLVPGGPEIDTGISTANALILIEAKWQSEVGAKQGKMRNKSQIQLRGEFLAKYGSRLFPNRTEFAVVGISLFTEAFRNTTPARVAFRSATCEQICGFGSHPQAEELGRYFRWKREHTKTANNRIQRMRTSRAADA